MTYQTTTTEGRAIELTAEQTSRYDAGDETVIATVADTLPAGEYSIYAPDGGPLLANIVVAEG